MSIDKVGGPGAAGYGPSSTTNDQTTVKLGEHSMSDVANRLGVDVSALMKANPQILNPQQKLTAGQELTLPQSQSTTSPRDVATGQASGKRMHKPIRAIAENAPTNYGQEVKLSAAHLPQLQGGASSSTPAADKSAKFEYSKKYSKADVGAGKIDTADQLLRKDAPVAQKSTTMFEITQDVTVNKAKTADKAFSAMDGYIKQ